MFLKKSKSMKPNYFTINKNKNPKKAKYSRPYTKKQRESIERIIQDFNRAIEKIKSLNQTVCTADSQK